MRFNAELVKQRINEIKPVWEAELKPFVLEEIDRLGIATISTAGNFLP